MASMANTEDSIAAGIALPADWRDFVALTKPRVMSLVVFTGLCGLLAAPGAIHPIIGRWRGGPEPVVRGRYRRPDETHRKPSDSRRSHGPR